MVNHLQIGILSSHKEGRDFLASSWGKKSQSSDITLYSIASKDIIQTSVIPEAYPKKPMSLVITAHMADLLVVSTSAIGIDATVGEAAILADCLEIPGIKAVLGGDTIGLDSYLQQMDKIFAKLSIKNFEGHVIHNGKAAQTAKIALEKLYQGPRGNRDGYLAINVDHAFPVQGVGSVILGTIVNGTVTKGQQVQVFPSGQKGNVRSIQVNDENVNAAGPGTHVGLAMKGLLPKFLERGTVITSPDDDSVEEVNNITVKTKPAAFGKSPAVGARIHVVSGLFNTPGTVESWNPKEVSVKFDQATPVFPDNRMTFLDLNQKPVVLASKK